MTTQSKEIETALRYILGQERDKAEHEAWNALSRYKFSQYGYWASIWVHLNRISGLHSPNPFSGLVNEARMVLQNITQKDSQTTESQQPKHSPESKTLADEHMFPCWELGKRGWRYYRYAMARERYWSYKAQAMRDHIICYVEGAQSQHGPWERVSSLASWQLGDSDGATGAFEVVGATYYDSLQQRQQSGEVGLAKPHESGWNA